GQGAPVEDGREKAGSPDKAENGAQDIGAQDIGAQDMGAKDVAHAKTLVRALTVPDFCLTCS
ncbi:MAG TPA: hypothetical protein VMO00_04715, partial [Methylomirabilota bacterium]|nr:hypothetical protein [Methylomirabilota bacterium]